MGGERGRVRGYRSVDVGLSLDLIHPEEFSRFLVLEMPHMRDLVTFQDDGTPSID